MTQSLRSITFLALAAMAMPALATPGNDTDSQQNFQQKREHYEQQRDELTGANKIESHRQRAHDDQNDEGQSAFLDAPVDTEDAPDQRTDDAR
ncbi:hypothetical protein [Salinicola halophilus]|uniref:hypothetical protein n=1 Tax=Salinicola halophilus TaxID=184065 RepID=UPI000DA14526|nr:hypothetical protein [Salinicola halophilus]